MDGWRWRKREREREREEGKREDSTSVVVGYTAGSTSMVHRMTFPSVG